jgi:Sel1 repeat
MSATAKTVVTVVAVTATATSIALFVVMPEMTWRNYHACNQYGNISWIEWHIFHIRPLYDPCEPAPELEERALFPPFSTLTDFFRFWPPANRHPRVLAPPSATPPVAAGPGEDAMAAYARGDYITALRILRPLADQGDAQAQYNLGVLYDNGLGVPQDDAEAMKWYRKAAEPKLAGCVTSSRE